MRSLLYYKNTIFANGRCCKNTKKKTNKTKKKKPENQKVEGEGIGKDIADTALDLFFHQGVPYLTKKGVEMGRYYASEALRNPQPQQRAINYVIRKATPILQKVGTEALNQFSTSVRPNLRYKTDRPDLDKVGRGVPVPFPFVDFKKLWDVVSNPKLFKGPEVSAEEGRKMVADYKRQYAQCKKDGDTRSYGSWIKWKGYGTGLLGNLMFASPEQLQKWAAFVPALVKGRGFNTVFKHTLQNYYGKGVDIHNLIGKLPRPKRGFTLPGHNYTGPYNPLYHQLDYDPETGEILHIFQQPTGTTDAVAMQHDVDYSSCGYRAKKYGEDEKKCKHVADRKMVRALDSIPHNQRQWGHTVARNAINAKEKLGLGMNP